MVSRYAACGPLPLAWHCAAPVDGIIRGCAGLRVLIQGGTEIGPFVVLRSSPVLCLED
jgi:hypothetical protein